MTIKTAQEVLNGMSEQERATLYLFTGAAIKEYRFGLKTDIQSMLITDDGEVLEIR